MKETGSSWIVKKTKTILCHPENSEVERRSAAEESQNDRNGLFFLTFREESGNGFLILYSN